MTPVLFSTLIALKWTVKIQQCFEFQDKKLYMKVK